MSDEGCAIFCGMVHAKSMVRAKIPRKTHSMNFSVPRCGIWNIPLELESNWLEPITHLYVGIVQLFTSPYEDR